jgi:hypothetical protein
MNQLTEMNLSFNPFRDITPTMGKDQLVWAEMHTVKSQIQKAYSDCLDKGMKELVLNWGPYGGGKTFSSYYFLKNYDSHKELKQIYIRCPKDGNKAVREFFTNIIDDLTLDVIRIKVSNLIMIYGESTLKKLLTPVYSSEFANAICLLNSDEDEVVNTMNRFFYSGLTKTELKKLSLSKNIQSDIDIVKILSGIFYCFIGGNEIKKGHLVFWIDEMEDLIYYSSKNYKSFSQILRDLFDSISDNFLVFMNFTFAENEDSTIELILGAALWSRVTKKIRFRHLDYVSSLVYVEELLNHSRINKENEFPLSNSQAENVLKLIPEANLTPREINKYFRSLINYGIDKNVSTIDSGLIEEWYIDYTDGN